MEEPDRIQSTSLIAAESETAPAVVREEEVVVDDDDRRPPQPFPYHTTGTGLDDAFPPHFQAGNYEETASFTEDTWSCLVVVITFWFFVSLTLILGVYGTSNLELGPNASVLIKPNSLFVKHMMVEEIDIVKDGPLLYGLHKIPPLDVAAAWSEAYRTSLLANTHKDWTFYFNAGSQISISYNVKSLSSSSLVLVIAQGTQGLARWLEDPYYPNAAYSWSLIHGNGSIWLDIPKSSSYHVAVGNLNSEMVEAHLKINIRAMLYNTNEAYYKCRTTQAQCGLKLNFPGENVALLQSPSKRPDTANSVWTVKISYGPRWITYLLGIGGTSCLVLLVHRFLVNLQQSREDSSRSELGDTRSERFPMLSHKHDDSSSLGSSYCSQDDEKFEDATTSINTSDGKTVKESDAPHLCAICFDAPRDCFFIPCGHCLSCFECGTRIAEAAGTCPVCRRRMKKVKKIYTV
ncbi:unnamed protein product [Cuscuta campestris]|uniref:RING-type domain-containing protein n=1 Tax=Cuscuta campestris TaxID=132261 RepID=A0A484MPQ2_9ASTE|nr:unnamed protein product [Cuscuta campestris]